MTQTYTYTYIIVCSTAKMAFNTVKSLLTEKNQILLTVVTLIIIKLLSVIMWQNVGQLKILVVYFMFKAFGPFL